MKILKLNNAEGKKLTLAGDNFEISELGTSSQWHGSKSAVRIIPAGTTYSVVESIDQINRMLEEQL